MRSCVQTSDWFSTMSFMWRFLSLLQHNRVDLDASVDGKHPCSSEPGDEVQDHKSHRNLLLPNLGNLLGDEFRQFSALRHCRSPARGVCKNNSPKSQAKLENHSLDGSTPLNKSSQEEFGARKPNKLVIPTINCLGSPDLSPRFVLQQVQ